MNNCSQYYNGKEVRYNARYDIWIDEDGVIYKKRARFYKRVKLFKGTSNLGRKYWCFEYEGKRVYAHRVIAYCWCEGYKGGLVVDHIDNNTLNNHPYNLRWLTQSENVKRGIYKN